jgi:hypothetical protein
MPFLQATLLLGAQFFMPSGPLRGHQSLVMSPVMWAPVQFKQITHPLDMQRFSSVVSVCLRPDFPRLPREEQGHMSLCDHRLHIYHSSLAEWLHWPVTPSEGCFHISNHLWFWLTFQVRWASGHYQRSKQTETENKRATSECNALVPETHEAREYGSLFRTVSKVHLSASVFIFFFPPLAWKALFKQGKLQLPFAVITSIPDGEKFKLRCHRNLCVPCSLGCLLQEVWLVGGTVPANG